jgi:Protein of unknown function (DUF2586)
MALPNINFVKSTSGLGRALPGTDYISGYVHYYPSGRTLPSGFTSSDRIKKIFSVADAVTLGITDASLGETKAVAKIAVTTAGTVGDTVTITYNGIEETKLSAVTKIIDAYVLVTADVVSTTTAAAALAAAINAGTASHGFTATSSVANLLITTKAGEGIFPNSGTPYAYSTSGTFAGTVTQPTGSGSTVVGVASFIDIAYYNISEYFRMQPQGVLYVGMYVEESTYAYADVTSVINYAQGEIKQLAVYHNNTVWATTQPTALQAVITSATTYYKQFIGFIQAEISGTASLASLTDISTLTAPSVSVCIAQDNYNDGYHLYKATGKSIGAVGTLLGSVALAAVNESIGWVSKFNVSNVEFDNLGFANGQVYTAVADSLLETLNNYAFIFLRKFSNITGSYWSNTPTCITATSDYSTIENNRTYNKITRNVRASMLPALSSPLKVNADGTLSNATIGYFESLANAPLEQMEADGEISDYKIIINPNQDVLSTSTLELTLQNVPMGVARIIKVNVGFVKSV